MLKEEADSNGSWPNYKSFSKWGTCVKGPATLNRNIGAHVVAISGHSRLSALFAGRARRRGPSQELQARGRCAGFVSYIPHIAC